MKRVLLFTLPILIIITIIFAAFGFLQARFEEEKLIDELKRKARAVAESVELSAKHILSNKDQKSARKLVESFQKRERAQGCVIYDKNGRIFAITEKIFEWRNINKPDLVDITITKKPKDKLDKFKEYSIYSYIVPVLDDEENILGFVEVIYDTSYMFITLSQLWKRVTIALTILLISITVGNFRRHAGLRSNRFSSPVTLQ